VPETACKSHIVMVRTHSPMPGMIRRMHEFSDDLKGHHDTHFIVSVDNLSVEILLPKNQVHRYTFELAKDQFPGLTRATRDLPNGSFPEVTAILTNKWKPSGYNFHMEPVLLAADFARETVNVCRHAQYWVMEDDVFICGKLSQLIKYYDTKFADADLLDSGRHINNGLRSWGSREYQTLYPMKMRVMDEEHVMRFSSRLLDHIWRLGREGITAESEWFASTVAKVDGFRHEAFDKIHIGAWSFDNRMNESSANELCHKRRASQGPLLNHAGKF